MRSYYKYLYLLLFILLSIIEMKFSSMRVGQLFLLILFFIILIDDYNHKQIDTQFIFLYELGVLVMVLISLNSIEDKIGEYKFIIKYAVTFMAAFYVGAKSLQKVSFKDMIFILEMSVAFYIFMAFVIDFHLLPDFIFEKIVHYRFESGDKFLDFQGTFDEPASLAIAIYLLALSAFLLR